MENNFIHHITDKGVSIGQQSTVFSKNNTLVECSQGFGIKDEGFGSIEQTTFYNNINDIVAFEKNIGYLINISPFNSKKNIENSRKPLFKFEVPQKETTGFVTKLFFSSF